ncbi:SRPBCC family protein, partial [Streptomyces sp. NPDC096080]|uniref:SRPBCC family protein n=1 Tax=Streptomyces sp. NPDC096080 TaxID=3156693 RepID=UPI0033301FB8
EVPDPAPTALQETALTTPATTAHEPVSTTAHEPTTATAHEPGAATAYEPTATTRRESATTRRESATTPHDPAGPPRAADFAFTRRAWVDASPARVYELVSDVSSIGRWSPDADDVAFDPEAGPRVGAWFSGRNRRDGREWTSRSEIVRADPGTAFGFAVGGARDGIVHWEWTLTPQGGGTVVGQSWRLLRLDPVLGTTRAELDALRRHMAASAETTLVALAQWLAEEHRN